MNVHTTELKETWTVSRIGLLEGEVQKLSAEKSRLTSELDSAREDLEKSEAEVIRLRQQLEEFETTTEKLDEPSVALDVRGYEEIISELEYRIGNWEDKYQKLDEKHRQMSYDTAYLVSQHTGAVWMLLNELDLVVDLDDALQRDLLYLINLLIRKDYRD